MGLWSGRGVVWTNNVLLDYMNVILCCCTFSWASTHASGYAAVHSLGLPHARHATLLYVLLDFHAFVMLGCCTFSLTSTHASCYADVHSFGRPHIRHTSLRMGCAGKGRWSNESVLDSSAFAALMGLASKASSTQTQSSCVSAEAPSFINWRLTKCVRKKYVFSAVCTLNVLIPKITHWNVSQVDNALKGNIRTWQKRKANLTLTKSFSCRH